MANQQKFSPTTVATTLLYRNKNEEDKNDLAVSQVRVYEDPDKSQTASQEKYEMTQSPVYETQTTGEPVPQPTEPVSDSSHNEFS